MYTGRNACLAVGAGIRQRVHYVQSTSARVTIVHVLRPQACLKHTLDAEALESAGLSESGVCSSCYGLRSSAHADFGKQRQQPLQKQMAENKPISLS